jgi:heme/copper-type cytochrome/quinol oxidase subunit 3
LAGATVVFLGLGFGFEALTCWQQSRPAEALPGVGAWALRWLGPDVVEGGAFSPDLLRAWQTLGGVLVTWLALVTLQMGGLGIRCRAFALRPPLPRLAGASSCLGVVGGLALVASFFAPGGPARVGWPAYLPPVETVPGTWRFDAQTLGLFGLGLLGLSLLFAAVNGLAALRGTAGLVAGRTRSWCECAQGLAAGLLLVGVPIALAVVALQLMDNVSGSRLLASLPLWPDPVPGLGAFTILVLLAMALGVAAEVLLGTRSAPGSLSPIPKAAQGFAIASLLGVLWALDRWWMQGMGVAWQLTLGVAFGAVSAAAYHRFAAMTGRMLNEFWGQVHCVLSLLYLGLFLLPSLSPPGSGGAVAVDSHAATQRFHALWMLALAQTPLGVNWLWSRRYGPPVPAARSAVVVASAGGKDVAREGEWTPCWRLFPVATIIGFLALVFFALRVRAGFNDWRIELPGGSLATLGTFALVVSAASLWTARSALQTGRQRRARLLIGLTVLLGLSFLAMRGWEYRDRLTRDFVRLTDGRERVGRIGGQAFDGAARSPPGTPARRSIQLQRGGSPGASVLLPAGEVELIESLGPWHSRPLAIWFLLTGLHALLVMAGVLLLASQLAGGGGTAGGAGRSRRLRPAGVSCWVVATAMGVVLRVLFAV